MALLLIRHGSTSLNVGDPSDPKDQFRGSGVDLPLSDFGVKTGKETAAFFNKLPIHAIISSPMLRAQQMAQMLSQTTKAPIQTDERLRPWHLGVFSGQEITPKALKTLDAYQEQMPHVPPPGSNDAFNDFKSRTAQILPELLQAGQNQNVAIVAHHRTALMMASLLYNKPLEHTGPPLPGGVIAFTAKGVKPIYTPPQVSKQEGSKGREGAPS